MSITVEFGTHLKELRQQKEFNLEQLAKESGISAAQISRIENGKRVLPKPQTIKSLSVALGVTYEELMRSAGYLDSE